MLEVQVAFAILGIGLAGLCPLVVMRLRQVRQLELRLQGTVVQTSIATGQSQTMLPGVKYYLVPWSNPWARKLSGSAQILKSPSNSCDPGSLPLPAPAPHSFPVKIIELDASPISQTVTAYVDVSAP
jgi:type II secretory pathway pseudopilin PulG